MATRKIADLTQATTASDADLMVIQDTSKTKKITFATLLTSIKSKLGVGTAANLNTTSKELVGAINEINTNLAVSGETIPNTVCPSSALFNAGKVHTYVTGGMAKVSLNNGIEYRIAGIPNKYFNETAFDIPFSFSSGTGYIKPKDGAYTEAGVYVIPNKNVASKEYFSFSVTWVG